MSSSEEPRANLTAAERVVGFLWRTLVDAIIVVLFFCMSFYLSLVAMMEAWSGSPDEKRIGWNALCTVAVPMAIWLGVAVPTRLVTRRKLCDKCVRGHPIAAGIGTAGALAFGLFMTAVGYLIDLLMLNHA